MPEIHPPAVLLTRPEPGASRTAARLREMGFCPVLAPAFRIQAVPAHLPEPARIQAVLITSANALPALPAPWHTSTLFTVGGTTAKRAHAAGFTNIHNADGDGDALAALVARAVHPADGPLLLLSGRRQGVALAASLRAQEFRVLRRAVYAARPIPHLPAPAREALAAGRIAHALFFSAETARSFLRQVHRAGLTHVLRDIEAITIGQPARMALKCVPWRRIRVAERPTQDSMLACLT